MDAGTTRKVTAAFIGLIVAGTALLCLPGMAVDGPMPWVDALFMATSAVCVTGLATLDMERQVTPLGHGVILCLIQLGGIGIVTLASVVILAGRRLSIGYEDMLSTMVAASGSVGFRVLTLRIITFTVIIEGVGILALIPFWPERSSASETLWECLFHAVSAFCNAGFSLFSTNLEAFAGNPGVNVVIMMLIILGGFGFMNLNELFDRIRLGTARWSRFSLFFKVTLILTLAFNGTGALILFAIEANGAFAHLSLGEAALAALFQAVTTRTAGFNTVPIASLTNVSLIIMMLWMFVGGASGSCAGGAKVGTVAVIFAVLRSYVRNDTEPILFGRRIAPLVQRKALVLLISFPLIALPGFIALDLADEGLSTHALASSLFGAYVFETVSALGTVGLSTGITPTLEPAAKITLVFLMFIGRLGPLLLIAAWTPRSAQRQFSAPEEGLPIG